MGDVAQILSGASAAVTGPNKALKMAGMPKSVMDLIAGGKQDHNSASLPPIVPTFTGSKKSNSSESSEAKDGDITSDEVKVKIGNKVISSSKPARPWTWAPFASSSRTDGAMFYHWVRANVEYTDYPYAKFDIHLDPVIYSDEEYQQYLKSDTWTQSETNKLIELARTFELRWPVIYDRWIGYFDATADEGKETRKIEDLQYRYYGVAATLSQVRIAQAAAQEAQTLSAAAAAAAAQAANAQAASGDGSNQAAMLQEKADAMLMESAAARSLATSGKSSQPLISHIGSGTNNKMFDLDHERERRYHLDRLWNRSKEEEAEEVELRKELRIIEAQLRKLKKSGGHLLAAVSVGTPGSGMADSGALPSRLSSAPSSRNPSRSVSPVNVAENSQILDQSFASTAPVPMPQNPYLQSGRLVPPAAGPSGINKSLLTRMEHVLAELHVPPRPLPTKRVCDLYDAVRKDILTLITLQKLTLQKEGTLQSKRVKLAKLGGASLPAEDAALDEERLLGIEPPAPPPVAKTAPAAATVPTTGTKPKSAKKKVTSKGKGVKKNPSAATGEGTEATAGAKPTVAVPEGTTSSTAAAGTGKKKTVKRKRKSEPGKSLNPAPVKKGGVGKTTGSLKAAAIVTTEAQTAAAAAGGTVPQAATVPATGAATPSIAAANLPTSSGKKRARKS
ncbi:hypothetical protein IV203_018395 [Nitzschia inconspicua]|uniref:dAMP1 SANT/Myb-like domain-containing protein n=1 Tax=Nitzschia inconspicua TaxID=303405 RepID=A0A9K3Q5J5_9STRA|nr:hypothetical protein IV203_018395 [Nitzschia inconspicua]